MANVTIGGQGMLVSGTLGSPISTIAPVITVGAGTVPWMNTTLATQGFKKYQVIEAKQDLLALSVARRRLDADCQKFSTLLEDEIQSSVIQEDHETAEKIRDYYQKKFVWWELQGTHLTAFRTELRDFVHADGKRFKESMVPLAWRLPEFYEYDTEFEKLHREFNQIVSSTNNGSKELKLVRTFDVKKKHSKKREFWFKDDDNNLVYIPVVLPNPLIGLLEHASKAPLNVQAVYTKRSRDGKEYLTATKLEFI